MRRFFGIVIVAAALAVVLLWWLKVDPQPPSAALEDARDVVGREASWNVAVQTTGRSGLRSVDVQLRAGNKAYLLFEEQLSSEHWLGSRVSERRIRVAADLRAAGIPDGAARLEVFATTYGWHLIPPRAAPILTQDITIDTSPPRLSVLSKQHNLRLGGSAVALFRVSPDTAESAVVVGDDSFPSVQGYFADPQVALSVFAVAQDLSTEAQPRIRAVDAVGNTIEVPLVVRIRGRTFRERRLKIGDGFLQRKVPGIFAAVGETSPDDPVEAYLYVNGTLRERSEEKLRELTSSSVEVPLWDGAFRGQPNAAPMSAFGDRRLYVYEGEVIDRRTHLGYDLASVQRAPIEASQNAIVVFGDHLGIYGNTVVLDHGLGVFSLYGHMSTIAVEPGQRVEAGEVLGQSGETGLAGGDHLHFSILLRGVHVDPLEWWDAKWMADHVTAKLASFPRAAKVTPEEATKPPAAAEGTGLDSNG